MAFIDTKPPPITPRERIKALEPGQSLCMAVEFLGALKVAAWREAKAVPGRVYKVGLDEDGARVWRMG